jgi:hypothetical protein
MRVAGVLTGLAQRDEVGRLLSTPRDGATQIASRIVRLRPGVFAGYFLSVSCPGAGIRIWVKRFMSLGSSLAPGLMPLTLSK